MSSYLCYATLKLSGNPLFECVRIEPHESETTLQTSVVSRMVWFFHHDRGSTFGGGGEYGHGFFMNLVVSFTLVSCIFDLLRSFRV